MREAPARTPAPATVLMIAGGVALAALTFVTWFEGDRGDLNAWDGLRRSDVVIFAAGLAAAAAGGWLMFGDVSPELRAVALIGGAAAAIGALVVIVRIVSPPEGLDIKFGIFLALAAALIAGIGGLMALLAANRSPPAT
jgi:hypothetical protein